MNASGPMVGAVEMNMTQTPFHLQSMCKTDCSRWFTKGMFIPDCSREGSQRKTALRTLGVVSLIILTGQMSVRWVNSCGRALLPWHMATADHIVVRERRDQAGEEGLERWQKTAMGATWTYPSMQQIPEITEKKDILDHGFSSLGWCLTASHAFQYSKSAPDSREYRNIQHTLLRPRDKDGGGRGGGGQSGKEKWLETSDFLRT